MAKRIVNKAERNAERYDAKETGYRLFEDSQNGKTFDRLMPLIVSEQNIILAYRNICKNRWEQNSRHRWENDCRDTVTAHRVGH